MNKLLTLFVLLIICTACDNRPIATVTAIGQDGLRETVLPGDKVKVINFWATWCAPCVEELPYFESIGSSYLEDVDMIFISLDEKKNIQTAVEPFLKKKEIKSTVLLLDDPYAAEWIPIVDQHWDGAIPVTLIVSKNKKQFYNKALSKADLEKAIKEFL
ncbi:thiol-disulfide isomerase/thioredoxin [Nonlabens xylanidelens]|uniref:Thiol-disulfide isomerase/thioredoxin n=1 Tax=Nonlabens xylanidelens TaxID=191564 RepID=A0A2S6IFM4_9FLAO|nr:TlpA disulfide reductase family protein [Nonlabens xylanidelens]PPK93011.1 thiol-disulfide isomerase/thioredoxin [Nonlabens xylanidelens]PQJ18780.1 thioredoxin [Nonlabens xylanidelens]